MLSVIICTYMRDQSLLKLLLSIKGQTFYPGEIIIVDGSLNNKTKQLFETNAFQNLRYFKVDEQDRGLTKQRNYGINLVSKRSDVVCFLDDDTVLFPDCLEQIMKTYKTYPNALGVGGYIADDVGFKEVGVNYKPTENEFYFDGWMRKDSKRFVIRKKFGLDCDTPPGILPQFSHARSISFLPPSNKVYEVELLMGCIASFKTSVFKTHQFSTFFEGYGLYEDADFTIRVAQTGKVYVNTAAKLYHYHEASGRPNQYKYGKMVVRNGYHIWRTKNPKPTFKNKVKWHAITLLLTLVRFSNTFTSSKKREAFSETVGRMVGWFKVLIS
ncbi:glycosyltransferase family 2 protein [Algibacter sp. PT7-4]|uniref:glycosyltransferase family 2 protein n=1 Tax=Algibacter ulvanivorans TaxID=3400999 RepID=UPI003AAD1397